MLALVLPSYAAEPEESDEETTDVPDAVMVVDALSTVTELASRKDWKGVAEEADKILSDSTMRDAHAAAWGYFGAALDGMGKPYAALSVWGQGLEEQPLALTPHFGKILDGAENFSEDVWVGGLMVDALGVPLPKEQRNHLALLAARYHFEQQSWGNALAMSAIVPDESKWGLEASVLRGVVLAQQARYGDSLALLLPARERAIRGNRSDHYVAALSLNVARTFYASGNYARAMEYYGKVTRADDYWPQAHFERAWAHFAVQDMPGTLALLHTHNSPFFQNWYFPEADMMRAQALFLMCKFPEATKTIDSFNDRYSLILKDVKSILGTMDAETAFADGRNFVESGRSELSPALLRKLNWDQRFLDSLEAVDAADAESASLSSMSTAWARRANKALQSRRDLRVQSEGERVLDLARKARDELGGMLQDIELTRVDLLTLEADLLGRAAITGEEIEYADDRARVRKLRKKGKHVWAFDGEYWADELGWYVITASPDCPKNLQRGE